MIWRFVRDASQVMMMRRATRACVNKADDDCDYWCERDFFLAPEARKLECKCWKSRVFAINPTILSPISSGENIINRGSCPIFIDDSAQRRTGFATSGVSSLAESTSFCTIPTGPGSIYERNRNKQNCDAVLEKREETKTWRDLIASLFRFDWRPS